LRSGANAVGKIDGEATHALNDLNNVNFSTGDGGSGDDG